MQAAPANGYANYSRPNGYTNGASSGGFQPSTRPAGHASFHNTDAGSTMGDPYRIEKGITVTGRTVPPPVATFQESGFSRDIQEEVRTDLMQAYEL
jgi:hypothetical protein